MKKNAIVLRIRAGLLAALVGLLMLFSALPASAAPGTAPNAVSPSNITWEAAPLNITWE